MPDYDSYLKTKNIFQKTPLLHHNRRSVGAHHNHGAIAADSLIVEIYPDNGVGSQMLGLVHHLPDGNALGLKQLTVLPRIFHLDMPQDLVREAEKCETDQEVRQVGIEWGIQQCRELVEYGVPVLHFYTMGKSDNVLQIARGVF